MTDENSGVLSRQGSRRAVSVGCIAGFTGPAFDRWELVIAVAGVILGEEATSGGTVLPTPAIEKAPMVTLAGVIMGVIAGLVFKEVKGHGYI